jgi:type IV pilus biogenesis protein CpaD/CtpE
MAPGTRSAAFILKRSDMKTVVLHLSLTAALLSYAETPIKQASTQPGVKNHQSANSTIDALISHSDKVLRKQSESQNVSVLKELYARLDSEIKRIPKAGASNESIAQLLKLSALIEQHDPSGGVGPRLVTLKKKRSSEYDSALKVLDQASQKSLTERLNSELREQQNGQD